MYVCSSRQHVQKIGAFSIIIPYSWDKKCLLRTNNFLFAVSVFLSFNIPACSYWNNGLSKIMPVSEVQGQKPVAIFYSLFFNFLCTKSIFPSPLFHFTQTKPFVNGHKKSCSPLSHILFYLSVILFNLPFPLFAKYLPFFFIPENSFDPSLFSLAMQYLSLLILFPFDVFPGSSAFTCSPYLISPLFSTFSSHLLVLAPHFAPFFILFLILYPLSSATLFSSMFLPFFYLFPHIKKEPQHGSHPIPTQKLTSISLFWLFRSFNTMKHLLHSYSTTPQISLRKF